MTESQLLALIPIGSRWRHYKGGLYVVLGYARRESDLTYLVLYLPIGAAEEDVPWSRPVHEWCEAVIDRERGGWARRYERVEE